MMATLTVERPQTRSFEDELAELKSNQQGLARLPNPLFGKLPKGYEEDPLDPAGTAD